ncbi:Hypothetical protein, putative, partial [Bodo saltans]
AEHPAAIKLAPEILLNGAKYRPIWAAVHSGPNSRNFRSLVFDDKVWKLCDDEKVTTFDEDLAADDINKGHKIVFAVYLNRDGIFGEHNSQENIRYSLDAVLSEENLTPWNCIFEDDNCTTPQPDLAPTNNHSCAESETASPPPGIVSRDSSEKSLLPDTQYRDTIAWRLMTSKQGKIPRAPSFYGQGKNQQKNMKNHSKGSRNHNKFSTSRDSGNWNTIRYNNSTNYNYANKNFSESNRIGKFSGKGRLTDYDSGPLTH